MIVGGSLDHPGVCVCVGGGGGRERGGVCVLGWLACLYHCTMSVHICDFKICACACVCARARACMCVSVFACVCILQNTTA